MKVLVVHNAYQQRGGEDIVVNLESELLQRHGNLAGVKIVTNGQIEGPFRTFLAALCVVFSPSAYRAIRQLIRTVKPNVVHVHNFFPLISPAVFYACHAEGVPTVMTLHNYRIVCPTSLLMHDGKVTERSLRKGPWWAVMNRVYRGSLIGTALLSLMISVHRWLGTWRNKVDRFIVLSQFARSRFALAGVPAEAMVVKPNFVDTPELVANQRSGFLFVGRLSPEKGIDVLLDAVGRLIAAETLQSGAVSVVGDGPLANKMGGGSVNSLGSLQADGVRLCMQSAVALLLPSIWYEGFPMVLVEAYANGLPVIASRIGALTELVDDGVTGLLFEPGSAEDLAAKMAWSLANPEAMRRMGDAARKRYEERYTPERNYDQLMSIYHDAIRFHQERKA